MKAAHMGSALARVAARPPLNLQGLQVSYPVACIFDTGHQIIFAHTSFKWTNLASNNAGVIVAIVGIRPRRNPSAVVLHERGRS